MMNAKKMRMRFLVVLALMSVGSWLGRQPIAEWSINGEQTKS